ncbi:Fructose-bisphosphate aldolase class II [Streptomyces venezuelae ATCC 10712]|uniref:Fructose-bisphosphate aldolase n=1 Tax=Streptomyces venezuelae (strain ATCC 10712 / CBS 650.69 / DSM 40230 / JCM 4526 / NBRC 13096 / PD 04745) TaxID=953739 RepID=F2RBJ8_STRVP|nr:Fructose-bisphosphate aldolase class II [Streptomyces venezuelae ATCC 10712]
MPIATPEVYNEMLDRAKAGKFAYPAINVTSSQTLHAALRGFAEAESDGIIQISTGGAEFLGGQYNKDMVTGAVALAEFAHIVAAKYDITVALHTDHCPKDKLDGYVRPLLDISAERVKTGPGLSGVVRGRLRPPRRPRPSPPGTPGRTARRSTCRTRWRRGPS